jgi:hypothetical protein
MVVLRAGEPREVVHDDKVNFTFVSAAVVQQRLELAAVRGLGALTFFVEAFEDSCGTDAGQWNGRRA